MADFASHLARELDRYRDGEARLPGVAAPAARQRQLTRLGNAAYGAGLCLLMLGRPFEAHGWLLRAAERWRESYEDAPAGSWGRPIGSLKARILAGDWEGAADDAAWALEDGAAEAASRIGRYAGALALLVLADDRALAVAESLAGREDFAQDVGAALAALAAGDAEVYAVAAADVLASFESRHEYLEDVPVADTVLVLQALAERRGFAAVLDSTLLP
jgi:hypothetical protein